MTEKLCRNCKWARFPMTKHKKPRIAKDVWGKCLHPEPVIPPLPLAITKRYDYTSIMSVRSGFIDPDYSDCPCWEGMEPEEQGNATNKEDL